MDEPGILQRVAGILEEAASILDTYGLAKGHYKGSDGYCTIGAIHKAMGVPVETYIDHTRLLQAPFYRDVLASVRSAIDENARIDSDLGRIFDWNDEPIRTLGGVTDLLRSVAKDLRNES